MLFSTPFLFKYQANVSLKEGCLKLLGYSISHIFEESAKIKVAKIWTCTLELSTSLFSLIDCRHKPNLCCDPKAIPADEGFFFYAPHG